MHTHRQLAVKKKPRQERSRATVDAILEAATYILLREERDHFTTNHVAARAGVSIASLYQYFPNKASIVAALQLQHAEQLRARIPQLAAELTSAQRLLDVLQSVVAAVIEEHRIAPKLHKLFAHELPRAARLEHEGADAQRSAWEALVRPYLAQHANPELVLFIARTSLHAAVHEAAAEHPEHLDDPRFAAELVRLLERYLESP